MRPYGVFGPPIGIGYDSTLNPKPFRVGLNGLSLMSTGYFLEPAQAGHRPWSRRACLVMAAVVVGVVVVVVVLPNASYASYKWW